MDKIEHKKLIKPLAWFTMAGFCIVSLFGAPAIQSSFRRAKSGQYSVNTKAELKRLELLDSLSENVVTELMHFQDTYHISLPAIFRDPVWVDRLGLSSRRFKATWYVSNPYDLLPQGIQDALQSRKKTFSSRHELWEWCRVHQFPPAWKDALRAALIETTPDNLWRAGQGRKPFARNGQVLQPIVIEHGRGMFEVKDGHIATDPRVISLNSEVIMVARINGADQLLRVKATDVGGAVKGYHVDLPVKLHPKERSMHKLMLPAETLRNATVEILTPLPNGRKVNRGRKA